MPLHFNPKMDQHHGGAASLRPNSAHFHNLFSSAKPSTSAATTTSEDLNEDDIFFSASADTEPPSPASTTAETTVTLRRKSSFELSSGVLAVLPDSSDTHRHPKPLLQRKSSLSATKPIPAIPRPPSEREAPVPVSQSAPGRKFQHSAPMRVPILQRKSRVFVDDVVDDECDGEERLPPHEIVARRFGGSSATSSFSVLEGVGRTLKGRDLRQVRNAVWQQTGFLD